MGAPCVVEDELIFVLADPDRRFVQVSLDCDEAVGGARRFRQTTTGWTLAIPRPDLHRLEYRLAPTERDGHTTFICDPANSEHVRTAFGERSVALLPGYTPPYWLKLNAEPGTLLPITHQDAVVGQVPIELWSPCGLTADTAAPVLIVHDGPDYDDLAALGRYAAAMVASHTLPPFRMALLQPIARDEWYAANPSYVAGTEAVMDSIATVVPVSGVPVIMGASLGGLSALLVAVAAQPRFGGVVAQSGSFFSPALDGQEATYPFFDRVATAVQALAGGPHTDHPLEVALTCGVLEENYSNNVAMARTLRRMGHRVTLHEVADLHNYTAWRDSLDPALTAVLRSVWGARA